MCQICAHLSLVVPHTFCRMYIFLCKEIVVYLSYDYCTLYKSYDRYSRTHLVHMVLGSYPVSAFPGPTPNFKLKLVGSRK